MCFVLGGGGCSAFFVLWWLVCWGGGKGGDEATMDKAATRPTHTPRAREGASKHRVAQGHPIYAWCAECCCLPVLASVPPGEGRASLIMPERPFLLCGRMHAVDAPRVVPSTSHARSTNDAALGVMR